MATADLRAQTRKRQRLEGELRLLLDVFEGVLRERPQLGADREARFFHALLDLVEFEQLAGRELLAAAPQGVVADLDEVTLTHRIHDVEADRVEQRDAGLHDPNRSAVGIAAGDRLARVDAGADAGRDKTFCGDAIDVAMVEHRDLARSEPPYEVLRAAVDARDALRGEGSRLAPPQQSHVDCALVDLTLGDLTSVRASSARASSSRA